VVTGSTSLITGPVLIAFGIEPHVAVATNMLALVFMSAGGSLPFAQKGVREVPAASRMADTFFKHCLVCS
jgi:uncharacterized membrane protein YfcA